MYRATDTEGATNEGTVTGSTISFVIPACNEGGMIGSVIDSIRRHASSRKYEIIVVDDGSSDDTVQVARDSGARVFDGMGRTIGANRNQGAECADGEVLVFLDADVTLTAMWERNIDSVLARLEKCPRCVTGSHVDTPDNASWLQRTWYGSFAAESGARHVGSGHMIIRRGLFRELGGFREELETGEDYDLCMRARALGASVGNETGLRAVHHGFPETLMAFLRREAWHGRGDFGSLTAIVQSKVAVATIGFLLAHAGAIVAVITGSGGVAMISMVAMLAIILGSSIVKFGETRSVAIVLSNTLVFYFYYVGRSLGLIREVVRGLGRLVGRQGPRRMKRA